MPPTTATFPEMRRSAIQMLEALHRRFSSHTF